MNNHLIQVKHKKEKIKILVQTLVKNYLVYKLIKIKDKENSMGLKQKLGRCIFPKKSRVNQEKII